MAKSFSIKSSLSIDILDDILFEYAENDDRNPHPHPHPNSQYKKARMQGQPYSNTRERGTPQTLLKLYVVLPLFVAIATSLSTALSYTLFPTFGFTYGAHVAALITTFCGVLACLVGVLHGNMSVFSLSFGVAVVLASAGVNWLTSGIPGTIIGWESIARSSLLLISPCAFASIVVPVLSESGFLLNLSLSSGGIVSRIVLLSCQVAAQAFIASGPNRLEVKLFPLILAFGVLPLNFVYSVFVIGVFAATVPSCIDFAGDAGGTPCVIGGFGVAVMVILALFYSHRSHLNGSLTAAPSEKYARDDVVSRAAIIGMIYTLQSVAAMMISDEDGSIYMIPEILGLVGVAIGATIALLLASIFGAVGDRWYPVGSNQWQMTSVDTLALLFHFIFPFTLLFFRAAAKYSLLESLQHMIKTDRIPQDIVLCDLVLWLLVVLGVGLPVLNSLAPIGAFIFSRAYIHGQPSTKNIAIMTNLTDILSNNDNEKHAFSNLVKKVKEQDSTLNIFVTGEDLVMYPEIITSLLKDGHHLGVTSYHSCFEGKSSVSKNIRALYSSFEEVTGGTSPKWYLPAQGHRNPFALRAALENGMRVSFWSSRYNVSAKGLNATQLLDQIKTDVSDKCGGNLILITQDGMSTDFAIKMIETLATDISSSVNSVASLPLVVKEDHVFELRSRERN